MKTYLFLLISLISLPLMAQQTTTTRTIEVTGEHEISVAPQEIIFNINIEEYWAEEFEGKEYKDYKTKIEIEGIEHNLIAELKAIGITMKQITLKQTGNYWRARGKDFLINKNLEIKLKSFEKANEISNILKTRGIKNMNVARLEHDDLETLKIKVKAEALKAAKEKAEILADVYGGKVGYAISIVEIDNNARFTPNYGGGMLRANKMSMESAGSPVQYENFRKIKVSAKMRVLFEVL